MKDLIESGNYSLEDQHGIDAPEMCKPCPFCGCEMTPHEDEGAYEHPPKDECWASGMYVPHWAVPSWNMRIPVEKS